VGILLSRRLALGLGLLAAGCAGGGEVAEPALDLLIFAPHPDDETLGCAGVIQQAVARGRRAGVAVLTNGGGYPKAAAALLKKPAEALAPADFRELAAVRQRMSIASMALLGGRRADLYFLGYPDGGLAEVEARAEGPPFASPVEGLSATNGPAAADHHTTVHGRPAPYLRAAALGDIADLLHRRRPREIYVTHEADTHPDHQAAFRLVRDAAKAVGYPGPIFTYVVHGDARPALRERRVPLTAEERERKRAAIKLHALPVVHDTLGDVVDDAEVFWIVDP
jgi:LmbE family N-acetylglucosaminyl deacetylase